MSEHIGRSESLRLSISGGLAAMLPQADSSCADLANSSLARLPSCVVGREWSRFQLSRAVVMPGQLRHILRLWIQPHTSCYARPQPCAQLKVGRILHSCFRRECYVISPTQLSCISVTARRIRKPAHMLLGLHRLWLALVSRTIHD